MTNEEKIARLEYLVEDAFAEGFYAGRSESVCLHSWIMSQSRQLLERILEGKLIG